jgi:hypothetical protein
MALMLRIVAAPGHALAAIYLMNDDFHQMNLVQAAMTGVSCASR